MLSRIAAVRLVPLCNLRVEHVADGTEFWVAENNDPQCSISVDNGAAISAKGGWYEFAVQVDSKDGRLVSPCLYPDYGKGISENERIFLPDPGKDGWIRAVVTFKHPVCFIRFDPSVRPVTFRTKNFRLCRLSKARALFSMACGIRDYSVELQENSTERVRRFLYLALLDLVRLGPRRCGEQAFARYLATMQVRGDDYQAWIKRYELSVQRDRRRLKKRVTELPRKPLISILLPVYNTPEKWLRRCIDTVIAQAYPHWELCIADDASNAPHVRKVLQKYQERDTRIKVVFREHNGHISASSNSALELASGEYIALLDHDDELPVHALLEVAEAIGRHPEWRVIYSDEDKIDEFGYRFDPYFKPDWNYDLLLSHNCISHLGVYHTELVREVGGFREGTEGSQDWDLVLRCIERLDGRQIGHIAHVLYHWRAIPGSTALAPGEKNYAHLAAMRVIQAHLDRKYGNGTVHEIANHPGNYRVRYRVPTSPPLVSLIIPTRDRVDLLRQCVDSILGKTNYSSYEVVIVDNQSRDHETLEYLKEVTSDSRVKVIKYDAPFNYSAINNMAVRSCQGAVLGFINNDIEVIASEWLDEMVAHVCRPGIGAVGAKLYFPDNTIQHAGVILGFNGVGVHAYAGCHKDWLGQMLRAKLIQQFSAVTAACMLITRTAFEAVGGFDERLQVAYNDIDLCLKLGKTGYRNIWTPYAELYHHESATRGDDVTPEKRARFDAEVALMLERWRPIIDKDPAYNVNLAITGETFNLAFPPR
jgi:GT2 family glycosyltransferase